MAYQPLESAARAAPDTQELPDGHTCSPHSAPARSEDGWPFKSPAESSTVDSTVNLFMDHKPATTERFHCLPGCSNNFGLRRAQGSKIVNVLRVNSRSGRGRFMVPKAVHFCAARSGHDPLVEGLTPPQGPCPAHWDNCESGVDHRARGKNFTMQMSNTERTGQDRAKAKILL